MSLVPAAMVEVSYQGLVSIRGTDSSVPVLMLKDVQERSIAIPLSHLESELLQYTLGENIDAPEPPQPYRTLLSCLDKMGVELGSMHIHHSSEYDFPAHLILRPRSGDKFEIRVAASDGVIYSRIKGIPIFVDEELMVAIGAFSSQHSGNLSTTWCDPGKKPLK